MEKWFVKRDLDGFFGLFIDNLVQLILIVSLCTGLLHMPKELVFGKILPGAAMSILIGNIFYSYQAIRLAKKTGRDDVTALPYGINTVSLFGYIFFIMLPVYQESRDAELAWKVGLLACFLSGIIEFLGSFIGKWLRAVTPRAGLLSALAGIAITFISMDFAFKTFQSPFVAMLPLAIILMQYMSRIRLPLGLPGGLVAIMAGTIFAWLGGYMELKPVGAAYSGIFSLCLPLFTGKDLLEVFKNKYIFQYISIIIPMGLFNVIGSLQNLESAEAAGDRFNNFTSLAVNGLGSIAASLFGSAFPTTIYIGHPGWKTLGARTGYSVLNGVVITLICLTGTVSMVFNIIPLEAGICILWWIGIIIVAQAFQETPKAHSLAVAIGLFPALAAWALLIIETTLRSAGTTLYALGTDAFRDNLAIHGVISLERGFIFTSMILASISVFLIEKRFLTASCWSLLACILSYIGIIHAYEITPSGIISKFGIGTAPDFAICYILIACLFIGMHYWSKTKGAKL